MLLFNHQSSWVLHLLLNWDVLHYGINKGNPQILSVIDIVIIAEGHASESLYDCGMPC